MNLPEDVVIEILSRLPVKSLMKLRCVCKSWNVLLRSSNFISRHLNNYTNSSNRIGNARLLASHRDKATNKRAISLISDDKLKNHVQHQPLPSFLNDKFGHIRLVGPSNGIVCLYGFPDNIALWNPAIREFKILPVSTISRPTNLKVRGGDVGFGFDSKSRDFKVLQVLFCCSNELGLTYHVEIYTLGTNLWRKYDHVVPANIMYLSIWSTVYKNEIFCWWGQDGDNEVILSFDMSSEVFQKTPLPSDIDPVGGEHRIMRAIAPFQESVALIVYRIKQVEKYFDVWLMNEFGDVEKEPWTRLATIGPLSKVERPLGFWRNSELILENSYGQLVVYNPMTKELRNLGLEGKRDRLETLIYKESLVSIINT